MYLILSPSDIFYSTGVMIHEVGEVLFLMNNDKGEMSTGGIRKNKNLIMENEKSMNNEGIILCDARTSGLFDTNRFEIIHQRDKWGQNIGKYRTLLTDPDFLTQTLREMIEGYGVKLVMGPSPITHQRVVKTPTEIKKLRESQRINKEVFAAIQFHLQIGVTEREIARKIQILQLELGGDGPSFPPIVAFGEHTAIPHHSPTDKALGEEDIILLDMGLVYQGYCSDMTRCIISAKV